MLYTRIELKNINYEETLRHFYPTLSDILNKTPSNHPAVRLLLQLGETARKAASMLMDEIGLQEMDELICTIISLNETQLRTKLQEFMTKLGWGQCVKVGRLYAETIGERSVHIHVFDLQLDYGKLLRKPEVRDRLPELVQMIPMAGMIASMFESKLVRNDRLNSTIKSTAINFVEKSGLQMENANLEIMPMKDAPLIEKLPDKFPAELEETLLTAVARLVTRLVE